MRNWYEVEALVWGYEKEVAYWTAQRRLVKLITRSLRVRLGRWLVHVGEALLRPSDSSP